VDVENRTVGVVELPGDPGRRRHYDVRKTAEGLGETPPEIEDPPLAPDVLSDVLEVIAEEDRLAVDPGEVLGVLLRGDGRVGKAECNVVAQLTVSGDDDEVRVPGPEDGVRRDRLACPDIHVVPLLAEDGLIPHVGHGLGDRVVVHQLGVPERGRKDPEDALDRLPVEVDLFAELLLLGVFEEAGQRVVVGLVEDLDLAVFLPRGHEFLEGMDHLRPVEFGLLEEGPGHPEGDLEGGMGRDQLREHPGRGHIALLGDLEKYLPIHLFPEKLLPVGMQAEGLVELEVKRDERHVHLPEKPSRGLASANRAPGTDGKGPQDCGEFLFVPDNTYRGIGELNQLPNFDVLAISLKSHFFVIPVKTGIRCWTIMDSCFRRSD